MRIVAALLVLAGCARSSEPAPAPTVKSPVKAKAVARAQPPGPALPPVPRVMPREKRTSNPYNISDEEHEAMLDELEAQARLPYEPPARLPMGFDGVRAAYHHAIQLNVRGIRTCYDRTRDEQPGLTGTVTVELTLDPAGVVLKAASSGMPDIDGCVESEVRRLDYPPPGATVTLAVPFEFRR